MFLYAVLGCASLAIVLPTYALVREARLRRALHSTGRARKDLLSREVSSRRIVIGVKEISSRSKTA